MHNLLTGHATRESTQKAILIIRAFRKYLRFPPFPIVRRLRCAVIREAKRTDIRDRPHRVKNARSSQHLSVATRSGGSHKTSRRAGSRGNGVMVNGCTSQKSRAVIKDVSMALWCIMPPFWLLC